MRLFGIAAVAALATVAALGCTRQNPDFCCSDETSCRNSGTSVGVTTCADPDRPLCDDLGQYGPPRTCVADIGGECSTTPECTNPARPLCIDNRCVQCEDGDVANRCDNPTPTCDPTSNLCVRCGEDNDCVGDPGGPACVAGQCVPCGDAGDCTASAPVCDPTEHTCRGCLTDDECGADGVCDRDAGTCTPPGDILYVAPAPTGGGTACTAAMPCASLATALAIPGSHTIKIAAGSYNESLLRVTGRTIRFHGAGVTATTVTLVPSTSALFAVDGDGALTIDALTVTGVTSSPAITCDAARLTLMQTKIIDNTRGGVSINNCSFGLVNNLIVRNGAPSSTVGGVLLSNINPSHTVRFEHNTVVDNGTNTLNVPGVQCTSLGVNVAIESSIIINNTGIVAPATQVSAGCVVGHSNVPLIPGSGNNANPPMLDLNYHLMAASPAVDLAVTSTVSFDVDGDPRPSGAARDSGADERP